MQEHMVVEIPIKEIELGDNSRLEIGHDDLSELMESIKHQGLLQAIGVRPLGTSRKNGKKYRIIFGYRRLTAYKKMRKKFIPAKILNDVQDSAEEVVLNLLENDQRKSIDMFEYGRQCCHLMDEEGYTIKEIAAALSTKIQKIKTAVDIFKCLPEEYAGKVKSMAGGKSRSNENAIPATLAKRVIEMQRKYSLKPYKIKKILEWIEHDKTITTKTIDYVMGLMKTGLSLNNALDRVDQVEIKRYEVCIEKKQVKRLKAKYGSLSKAVQHILYASGEVKDPKLGVL